VTAPTTINVPVSIREARIAGSLRAVLADSAIPPRVTALVAGALVSLVRRIRTGPNAAILAGVIVIALAGTLTRFGGQETLYLGQMVGLIVLGAGMEWANRRGHARKPAPPIIAA
jgi:hypothetical protein